MSIFQNTCKPEGLFGKLMVNSMNMGHSAMAKWGFAHLKVKEADRCLDIGCGGGANIKRLLKMAPKGIVKGVDYSEVSVEKSKQLNLKAVQEGRCTILKGNAMDLIFAKGFFDVVTAFETIYFWPNIQTGFQEAFNVLKDGGSFLICNEADGLNPKDEQWVEKIDGMRIYTEQEICTALEGVGFHDIAVDHNEKHWICILAKK